MQAKIINIISYVKFFTSDFEVSKDNTMSAGAEEKGKRKIILCHPSSPMDHFYVISVITYKPLLCGLRHEL